MARWRKSLALVLGAVLLIAGLAAPAYASDDCDSYECKCDCDCRCDWDCDCNCEAEWDNDCESKCDNEVCNHCGQVGCDNECNHETTCPPPDDGECPPPDDGTCPPPDDGCPCPPPTCAPGVGTPGYWKNHPEAWPVTTLEVGWKYYTQAELLEILDLPTSYDKSLTLFRAMVAAKLNWLSGNPYTCIEMTMYQGNAWLAAYPIGSNTGKDVWEECGEPFYLLIDAYNNGLMCAPSRDVVGCS